MELIYFTTSLAAEKRKNFRHLSCFFGHLLTSLLVILAAPMATATNCYDIFGSTPVIPASPSIEELQNKVFAVSALRSAPTSKTLPANTIDHLAFNFNEPWNLPALVRFGVHFSLGELVRTHSGITEWENRKIAIIKPLKDLTNVINLNPFDTFTAGDTKLTPLTTLVLPYDSDLIFECDCKIFRYDPKTTTLRAAVDTVISQHNGWALRMKEDVNDQLDAEFEIGDQKFKASTFFKSLLAKYPYISIGNEIRSLNSEAFRFTVITQLVVRLMQSFSSMNNDFGSLYFMFFTDIIENHLESILQSDILKQLPQEDQSQTLQTINVVQGMLNIARLDQYLRAAHSKTLVGSNLTPILWQSKSNLEKMMSIVEMDKTFLAKLKQSDQEPTAPAEYYSILLFTLKPTEQNKFLERIKIELPAHKVARVIEILMKLEGSLQ